MSFSYGNHCFRQAVNYEICKHAECTTSPNSVSHLFQTQHEVDNGIDEEMNKILQRMCRQEK